MNELPFIDFECRCWCLEEFKKTFNHEFPVVSPQRLASDRDSQSVSSYRERVMGLAQPPPRKVIAVMAFCKLLDHTQELDSNPQVPFSGMRTYLTTVAKRFGIIENDSPITFPLSAPKETRAFFSRQNVFFDPTSHANCPLLGSQSFGKLDAYAVAIEDSAAAPKQYHYEPKLQEGKLEAYLTLDLVHYFHNVIELISFFRFLEQSGFSRFFLRSAELQLDNYAEILAQRLRLLVPDDGRYDSTTIKQLKSLLPFDSKHDAQVCALLDLLFNRGVLVKHYEKSDEFDHAIALVNVYARSALMSAIVMHREMELNFSKNGLLARSPDRVEAIVPLAEVFGWLADLAYGETRMRLVTLRESFLSDTPSQELCVSLGTFAQYGIMPLLQILRLPHSGNSITDFQALSTASIGNLSSAAQIQLDRIYGTSGGFLNVHGIRGLNSVSFFNPVTRQNFPILVDEYRKTTGFDIE